MTKKENGNILIEITPDEGLTYIEEHDVDSLEYIYYKKIIDGLYNRLVELLGVK